MALQIPKPNLGDAAANAQNAASNTASSGQASFIDDKTSASSSIDEEQKKEDNVPEMPVAPSTPPPATSRIPETPSVKSIEPKPPVAPSDPVYGSIDLKFEFIGCSGKNKWFVDHAKSESIFAHIEKMATQYRYEKKSNDKYEYNSLTSRKTAA